jgi:NitT/TauT family transport system substrate-binding protein
MTGANDVSTFRPTPIKSLKEADGRTVFSTVGSSTHMVVLGLEQQAGVSSPPRCRQRDGDSTQESGQLDVGWAAAPFGVEAISRARSG